jgi:hypothetical protein
LNRWSVAGTAKTAQDAFGSSNCPADRSLFLKHDVNIEVADPLERASSAGENSWNRPPVLGWNEAMIATIFVASVWHRESLGKPDLSLQFNDKPNPVEQRNPLSSP